MAGEGSYAAFRRRSLGAVAGVGLAGTALLYAGAGSPAAAGFLCGALGSAACLGLQGRELATLTLGGLTPPAALRRARFGSLCRTGVRLAVLAAVAARAELSLPWSVAGLFLAPAVLAGNRLWRRGGG